MKRGSEGGGEERGRSLSRGNKAKKRKTTPHPMSPASPAVEFKKKRGFRPPFNSPYQHIEKELACVSETKPGNSAKESGKSRSCSPTGRKSLEPAKSNDPLLEENGEKCKENSKDVSSTVAEQSKDNEMDDKHEGETAKDEGPKQEKDEEDMKEEKKVGEDLEIGGEPLSLPNIEENPPRIENHNREAAVSKPIRDSGYFSDG